MCVPHWNHETLESPLATSTCVLSGGASGGAVATAEMMRIQVLQEDRLKIELSSARARAMEVVAALKMQAQASQEKGFARADGRPDALRQVTGTSALEAAIGEATRVVEQYDRMLSRLGSEEAAPQPDTVVLQRALRIGPATIVRSA